MSLRSVRQIELDTGITMCHLHQFVIHIVPVDGGVFQKILKIGRVFNHDAADTVCHQKTIDNFNACGCGFDRNFSPVHCCTSFLMYNLGRNNTSSILYTNSIVKPVSCIDLFSYCIKRYLVCQSEWKGREKDYWKYPQGKERKFILFAYCENKSIWVYLACKRLHGKGVLKWQRRMSS